jgi:hypothetical protein
VFQTCEGEVRHSKVSYGNAVVQVIHPVPQCQGSCGFSTFLGLLFKLQENRDCLVLAAAPRTVPGNNSCFINICWLNVWILLYIWDI